MVRREWEGKKCEGMDYTDRNGTINIEGHGTAKKDKEMIRL